jgi:transcriptional regulator with XRE-family HTH domain
MRTAKTVMRKWLRAVDPAEAKKVAKKAGTSVPHLRHIAAGRRNVSADLAQRLAHAAPELYQRELCAACAHCPLLMF